MRASWWSYTCCADQSGGSSASSRRCAGPTGTPSGRSPSRAATRWWWLSTGSAGIRSRLKRSTAALVLGPTPVSASSHARACGTGISARNSSDNSPRRSVTSRSTCWMRGAFCSGQVHGAMASCTSAVGASRTASQVGKRRLSSRNACPELRLVVRCESMDDTSSLSGSSSWKYGIGQPYAAQRRSWTRSANSRRASGLSMDAADGKPWALRLLLVFRCTHDLEESYGCARRCRTTRSA